MSKSKKFETGVTHFIGQNGIGENTHIAPLQYSPKADDYAMPFETLSCYEKDQKGLF